MASAAVSTAALVALAVGSAFGRWRVLPVNASGDRTGLDRGTLVVATPVPAPTVKDGDLIFMRLDTQDPGSVRTVVSVVDSWRGEVAVDSAEGVTQTVKLADTAWRIDRQVPYAGHTLRVLAGPIQSLFLVLNGILLVAWSTTGKRNPPGSDNSAAGQRRRRRLRSSQPRVRAAAAAAVAGLALAVIVVGMH